MFDQISVTRKLPFNEKSLSPRVARVWKPYTCLRVNVCRPVITFQISYRLFQLESIPIREAPPKEIEKVGFSHLSDLSTSCSATCLFHPVFIFFLSLLNHFGGKSPSLEISIIIVSEEVQQLCTMSLALRGRGTIWAWQSSWRGRPHCPGQGQAGRPSETQQSGLLQIAQSADWNGAFIGQLASK